MPLFTPGAPTPPPEEPTFVMPELRTFVVTENAGYTSVKGEWIPPSQHVIHAHQVDMEERILSFVLYTQQQGKTGIKGQIIHAFNQNNWVSVREERLDTSAQ